MYKKIGVIGDKDSILGFKAIGLSVFSVRNAQEAGEVFDRIVDDDYAVIYITEQIASDMEERIDRYRDRQIPAIILIPSSQGSLGIGMRGVKKSMERAVGADILFGDD